MISFGPLKSEEEARLLEASSRQFGTEGYQHDRRYLTWLYGANPFSQGVADCLVARRDDAIVGCMHRMMLPVGEAGEARLAVLHNHFIADELRAGPGALLLRRAVRGAAAAFAPGVQAPLDGIYRQLGFVEQPGLWLARPLRPIAALIQFGKSRVFGSGQVRIDVAALNRGRHGMLAVATPSVSALETMARRLLDRAQGAGVAWTADLLRWRYFHPDGPRHLLITTADGDAMAVVAFGVRRGTVVARLLEVLGAADRNFLHDLHRMMGKAGATLALGLTFVQATADLLIGAGWRLRQNGTFSFQHGAPPLRLDAGASDVGFEAMRTVFA